MSVTQQIVLKFKSPFVGKDISKNFSPIPIWTIGESYCKPCREWGMVCVWFGAGRPEYKGTDYSRNAGPSGAFARALG